ncbi:M12 family metallopeptidase [Streptomyces virginiae]|uniref:M12 family metallopeptidase n=1 Tax=Streptomyces virginiae TaxID=1961 RepID=UPI00225A8603|nr:M12 family metallopeptidase [Streptomyces virginiae]MCX4961655.1 M12 family metallopeptidase [Streptomyces virginiae]MCX5180400.1 M12 family metallopeptidase [Streptomyces virginiae]
MSPTPAEPNRRTKKTAAGKKTAARKKSATGKPGVVVGSGEYRSGPLAGTALVSGQTFRDKGLPYADVDGMAVFEGDIILGSVKELRDPAATDAPVLHSVGITGPQFRWPNATVPFEIDPALPNPQRVTDAIAHWQAHTRIRFVPRTASDTAFVSFVPGGSCSSNVGRQGGRQLVTLGPQCSSGNAIHEIGHTVGLWHEQSREDRDQFVEIVFSNVDPAMQHNFLRHVADGDDLGPYDYGSIMHYQPGAFAIDDTKPTIVARQPLPPGVVMGQRSGLSQGDIDGVHTMYPAPSTFKEPVKDPVFDMKGPGKDPIKDPVFDIPKAPPLDGLTQPVGAPFVLATPHQAPALAGGQGDGLAEQVRQLTQLVGALQQSVSTAVNNQNTLVSQLGTLFAGGAGPAR